LPALIEQEQSEGFDRAEETIQNYLSGELFENRGISFIDSVDKIAHDLDPQIDVIFLLHTGAFAPHFFQISMIMERMKGKGIKIPIIIFYPGTIEGSIGLRFMDLRDKEPIGNYRANIYGEKA